MSTDYTHVATNQQAQVLNKVQDASDSRAECPVPEQHAAMPVVPRGFTIRDTGGSGYEVGTVMPSGRAVSVDVYAPGIAYNAPAPAAVNWSGIGSVSAEDAARFAELINAASNLARTLDNEATA